MMIKEASERQAEIKEGLIKVNEENTDVLKKVKEETEELQIIR
jgi:hypothetical protein